MSENIPDCLSLIARCKYIFVQRFHIMIDRCQKKKKTWCEPAYNTSIIN